MYRKFIEWKYSSSADVKEKNKETVVGYFASIIT